MVMHFHPHLKPPKSKHPKVSTEISRYYAIRLFLICAFLSFITNFPPGVPTASLNTAIEEFSNFIHVSYIKRGWDIGEGTETLIRTTILNSWYLGQFIGAMTLFSLAEKYGRLGAFKISVAVMGFGNLLQFLATLSSLPELFLCGRFLSALLSPLCDTCMIMYFQETTPIHYRGEFSFLGAMGYGLCTTLGMLLGTKFVLGNSLILLTGVQLPPVLIHLIFLFTCLPETPKYLCIVREDQKEAMKSLEFFQGKKEENVHLIQNYDHESDHLKHKHAANLQEVIKLPYLRVTILITIVLFVLTLPFYVILQSSTFMLENIGVDLKIAELSSLIVFISYTIACTIGTFIIERFPRRTLILTSGCLSLTFLTSFVIFSNLVQYVEWFKFASLITMIGFIVVFGMILSPIAWFISSELSIQRYRSVVYCVCFSLLNILITVTNSICMLTFKQFGSLTFIPLFIIPYILALSFLYKYLPETRDIEAFEVAEVIKLMTKHGCGAKKAAAMYAAQNIQIQSN